MKRNLANLSASIYDLVVVGAGVYGACIARDAAMRGLRVVLIDKGDFGGATSHNSLKLIHGGFRYLQHADLPRIRQSIRERRIWLSIAPHLVRPLKFVMPTYGHGMHGPEALSLAIAIYEAIRGKQDRALPPDQAIPKGRIISRRECLNLIPGIPEGRLRGGAIWYDGQMLNSDRVLLECVIDAIDVGAQVANYVAAEGFLADGDRIEGVRARDMLGGDQIDVRAAMTVNATGPWVQSLLRAAEGVFALIPLFGLTKGLNLITRQIFDRYAVGIPATSSRSMVARSGRMYFLTPWFDRTIVGTTHMPFQEDPDDYQFNEEEVEVLLDDLASACPSIGLNRADVYYCYGGLTPAELNPDTGKIRRARSSGVFDHRASDGVEGLISVTGVKFTTARLIAEQVVDLVCRRLGREPPPCRTAEMPLPGGRGFESRAILERAARRDVGNAMGMSGWNDDDLTGLVTSYGTRYKAVLQDSAPDVALGPDAVFRLQILYGIRHEMACRLSDLLLRRCDTAARGKLTAARIHWAADALAAKHGWCAERKTQEIEDLIDVLSRHHPVIFSRSPANCGDVLKFGPDRPVVKSDE